MKKILILPFLLFILCVPVSASEITAPPVPNSGMALMPEETESFADGLWSLFKNAVSLINPDLAEAAKTCRGILAAVLMVSLIQQFPGGEHQAVVLCGTVMTAAMLLSNTHSLISLGVNTIGDLSEYGKLLLPVMTSALAAQGGITGSAALYAGTTAFDMVLCTLIDRLLVPGVYLFLAMATASSALGEDILNKITAFIKWLITWSLKILLYIFTGYIGITGVVSGTTDAAALKAAKLTISGVVPVVGGILSDASEAVLVSAGLVKNAAGIYGIFAILAVFMGPFLKIGSHYLILKGTGAVCGMLGCKQITDLIGNFSSAMGLLLAMTGSVCLLLLISTVCFLKGVG